MTIMKNGIIHYYARLPRNMKPSRECWEKLGFVFLDDGGEYDKGYIDAVLPSGWVMRKTNHSLINEIIDINDSVRATVIFENENPSMNLACKYKAGYDYTDENNSKKVYYFGNEFEKIYIAGKVNKLEREKDNEELYKARIQLEDTYQKIVEEFAKEFYPDYLDPLAYWDIKKSNEKKKMI